MSETARTWGLRLLALGKGMASICRAFASFVPSW